MAQKLISVYITNEVIRMCEVTRTGNSVQVSRAFETETPAESVDDGMILNVEKVAAAVYRNLRLNHITGGKLIFSINSRKIANKEITIPYVRNKNKIDEIIDTNAEDYFPMDNIDDYIFKYTILDTIENAEGKKYRLFVVAVQKEMIESYYQLAKALKMPIETVDYYGNSIYNLLQRQLNQGTVLVLQMERDITYVNIMSGKKQLFRRAVPFGKHTLIHNLASSKGITEEEAARILRETDQLDRNVTLEEYSDIIRDLTAAIIRVVEFYATRNLGTVIEGARIMGEGIEIAGLAEILSRDLGVSVTLIEQLHDVRIKKKKGYDLSYQMLAFYLPCIGAVFGSLHLELEGEKERKFINGFGLFYILIVLASLFAIGASAVSILNYTLQRERKKELEEAIVKLAEVEAVYSNYTVQKEEFETIKAYYDSTIDNNEALYELMVKLEVVMPKSVGISNLTASNGELTMTCEGAGKEAVAAYVMELKKISYVSSVRVNNISDVYDEFGQVTSTFNITFCISAAGDGQEVEQMEEGGIEG